MVNLDLGSSSPKPVKPTQGRSRMIEPGTIGVWSDAEASIADRFSFWQGRSGRRYVFSTYTLDELSIAHHVDAVVIAARCDDQNTRHIIRIEQTGAMSDLVFSGPRSWDTLAAGATEVHVHLLAATPAARAAVISDLSPAFAAHAHLQSYEVI